MRFAGRVVAAGMRACVGDRDGALSPFDIIGVDDLPMLPIRVPILPYC